VLSINVKKIVELIQACHLVATRDVAKLYNVETKVLNQVIKRNINRFPEEFCFQITDSELRDLILRSHFVTSSWNILKLINI